MTWFKYVWIVLFAIGYLIKTIAVWAGVDEETSRGDWIAIHILIIFFISLGYWCVSLLW